MDYLIDNNIVIDKMIKRKDFYEASNAVVNAAIIGKIKGYLTTNQISDIYYVLRGAGLSEEKVRIEIDKLLSVLNVLSVEKQDCKTAVLNQNMPDFEDALITATAVRNQLQLMITRNDKDFEKSGLLVFSPEEILVKHNLSGDGLA